MNLVKTCAGMMAGAVLAAATTRAADPLVPPPLPEPKPPTVAATPPASPAARILPLRETISDLDARHELARALSYLKRFDESLAEYRRVLAARPDDAALRSEYGQVLFWSGQSAEAYAELTRVPASQLTPEARLALADLCVGQNRFDDAVALYRARIEAEPDDLVARFKLAEVLSWLKRYDESLALYRDLLELRPDDVQLRRRHALVLMWAGRLDASAAELRRTLPSS